MTIHNFKILFLLQAIFLLTSCDNSFNDENTILTSARTAFLTDNNLIADELYKKYLTKFPNGNHRIEAWERIYDISTYLRRTREDSLLILDSMLLEFKENKSLQKKILLRAVDLNVNLNRYNNAIDHLNTLLNFSEITHEETDLARLQLSKLLSLDNNNEQALNVIQQCFSSAVDSDIYCLCSFYKAHILMIKNKYEDAKDHLIGSLEKCSSDYVFFNQGNYILGEIYEHLDDKRQAINSYESILSSYPSPLLIKTKIQHLNMK
jgi:tetratricopeptide (TPR) repeat protein